MSQFALYITFRDMFDNMNNESKGIYTDMFRDIGNTAMERAKRDWLFDLYI